MDEMDGAGLLQNVKSYNLWTTLKILLVIMFTLFILYVPLGDLYQEYSDTSVVGSGFGSNTNTVAYSYLCNFYRAMSVTAVTTGNVMHKTMKFTTSVVLDILYKTKIMFYSLLQKVDRQDLCRSVCCGETEEFQDELTQREKRSLCKCKGKCRSLKKY